MLELYVTDKNRTDERIGYSFFSGVANNLDPISLVIRNEATKTQGYDIGTMPEYKVRNVHVYPVIAGVIKVEASMDGELTWDNIIADTAVGALDTEYPTIVMNPSLTFRFPTRVTFTPAGGDATVYMFVSVAEYGSNVIR